MRILSFNLPGEALTLSLAFRGFTLSSFIWAWRLLESAMSRRATYKGRVSWQTGTRFGPPRRGLCHRRTGADQYADAMGQARADSVPMLVVSGVNTLSCLVKGMEHLHEIPDQLAVAGLIALNSDCVET